MLDNPDAICEQIHLDVMDQWETTVRAIHEKAIEWLQRKQAKTAEQNAANVTPITQTSNQTTPGVS